MAHVNRGFQGEVETAGNGNRLLMDGDCAGISHFQLRESVLGKYTAQVIQASSATNHIQSTIYCYCM